MSRSYIFAYGFSGTFEKRTELKSVKHWLLLLLLVCSSFENTLDIVSFAISV